MAACCQLIVKLEDDSKFCGTCKTKKGANTPGVKFCVECAHWLCRSCLDVHDLFFQTHTITNGPNADSLTPKPCSDHDGMNVMFFCNNCKCYVCPMCLVDDGAHKTHDCVSISKRIEAVREDVQAAIDKLKTSEKTAEEKLCSLNKKFLETSNRLQELEKEVRKEISNLAKEHQMMKDKMEKELVEKRDSIKKEINELQKCLTEADVAVDVIDTSSLIDDKSLQLPEFQEFREGLQEAGIRILVGYHLSDKQKIDVLKTLNVLVTTPRGANHVSQVTNENLEPIGKPVTENIEASVVESSETAQVPREVTEIPAAPEETIVRIVAPQEAAEVTPERTSVPAPRRPSIENLVEAVQGEENEKYPTETVVIEKAGGPLGLSVVGGSDHSSHPFGRDEPGLFISKLVPGGAAERCGRLRCGDRILSVNEYDVTSCTHQQSVSALANSPQTVTLRVRHDPPPPNMQKLSLTKSANGQLGLIIVGGVRGHPANPDDPTDEGIFISRVIPDSAAARDARLQAGQRIMEVDGVSLLGATRDSAVKTLRASGENVQIVVCDGYIPSDETTKHRSRRITRTGSSKSTNT